MGNLRFIDLATQEALKSTQNFKHGAVLVKNGKLVSKGYNHSSGNIQHEMWSVHAEMDAVMSSKITKRRSQKFADCYKLYVVRVNSSGLADSKPCIRCQKFMKRFNIARVFYSTNCQIIDDMYV